MDSGGYNNHPRQQRGHLGADRRLRRSGRKGPNGAGAGDVAVKYRNKTWRREDVTVEEQMISRTQASVGSGSNGVMGAGSTTRLRHKQRPLWKSTESHSMVESRPMSNPMSPRPPNDAPPYRVPPAIQHEIEQGKYDNDQQFPGNRFLELKAMRPSMRAHSIKHKLISDPEHRTDLTGAITVVGTCLDMCPVYERHEREFQKDVDDWEKIPGTNPKRIDHSRAVKKYRRSAAGNDEPLESDLRPPEVLKMTLDYLFYELLDKHGLEATYAFIRDRTRAIRTDFTIQHDKGPIAIECFERIARFHILAVHRFCERDDVRGFDYWQEVEQMMKTLQSLIQFYDDNEGKLESPNEAEFRSYYILAHIRDTNSMRRLQALSARIFLDPVLQTALEFRSYAQRNTYLERRSSSHRAAKLKFRNSEACLNAFTRFFKRVQNLGTSYLMGCLLEYHFGGVRKGAIHALWKAYTTRHRPLPTRDLMEMLGMDTEEKAGEVAQHFGIIVVEDADESGTSTAVQLNRNSKFEHAKQLSQRHSRSLVESKRGELDDVQIVDGRFGKASSTWNMKESGAVSPTRISKTVVERKSSQDSLARRIPNGEPVFAPSIPSPTPFLPPPLEWGVSDQKPEVHPSNVGSAETPTSQVLTTQPFVLTGTPPTPAPESFRPPVPALVSTPEAPWTAAGSFPLPSGSTNHSLPVSLTKPVFTPLPPLHTQSLAVPNPPNQTERPLSHPVSVSSVHIPGPSSAGPPSAEPVNADIPVPAAPAPSLPRLTTEELLFERQQERRRAAAEALAQADRYLEHHFLFKVFTHWKHKVTDRGHARELMRERKEHFKSSIRDMGLSNTTTDSGRKMEYHSEEDLVSWEDTSQASSSVSLRKRSKKSIKRADDETTLAAIKETEARRLRLWESGTFLSSIVKRLHLSNSCPPGWEVWLSTTSENPSTAEWLRLKFGADSSTASTEHPGLDRILISETGWKPTGPSHGPGVLIIDLTPSMDESTIQGDLARVRTLLSSLPADRHYVPSVLLLQWTETSAGLNTPISLELDQFQKGGIIESWQILAFVNDDRHLDDQFSAALQALPMDTVGRLVERVSLDDVFKMFFVPWDIALNEWISSCQLDQNRGFDWLLYGKVITVMLRHINRLATETLLVCQVNMSLKQLPVFNGSSIVDQSSAFETFINYLSLEWLASNPHALLLRTELSVELSGGREFYAKAVLERLAHLMFHQIRAHVSPDTTFNLGVKCMSSKVASFVEVLRKTSVVEQQVQPESSPMKRNRTCDQPDDLTHSSCAVEEPGAKKCRHDVFAGPIGRKYPSSAIRNNVAKRDTLSYLRATVAMARQSMADLRSVRQHAERSYSPDSKSDTWTPMHGAIGSEWHELLGEKLDPLRVGREWQGATT